MTTSAPPLTSIAGRTAATLRLERERAAEAAGFELAACAARTELHGALRKLGVNVCEHHDPREELERVTFVRLRLAHTSDDYARIMGTLDELEWCADPARLSRVNSRYDVLRLKHRPTDTKVVVVVSIPSAEVPAWQAA
jgi:hypothetical protein